jgi:hypothetical protein
MNRMEALENVARLERMNAIERRLELLENSRRPLGVQDLEFGGPGDRVTIGACVWLRLEDTDPPYTSGHWANLSNGQVAAHWSTLAALHEKETN